MFGGRAPVRRSTEDLNDVLQENRKEAETLSKRISFLHVQIEKELATAKGRLLLFLFLSDHLQRTHQYRQTARQGMHTPEKPVSERNPHEGRPSAQSADADRRTRVFDYSGHDDAHDAARCRSDAHCARQYVGRGRRGCDG